MQEYAKNRVQEKGIDHMTVDELVNDITPKGRGNHIIIFFLLICKLETGCSCIEANEAFLPGMGSRLGVESWEFGDFWGLGVEKKF